MLSDLPMEYFPPTGSTPPVVTVHAERGLRPAGFSFMRDFAALLLQV
jgi:hypothetical protein